MPDIEPKGEVQRAKASVARGMWRVFEPVHAVTYFAPEVVEAFKACGLKGFWMGYFAGRSAPMGAVSPGVVEATFFNFAPRLVRRALPDAWAFAPPPAVLETRLRATHTALARALPTEGAQLERAVVLVEAAVESLDCAGRPLAAANAALEGPSLSALWQGCTTLREHRGDGHVAALVGAELDGCEAHVTLAATGVIPRQVLQLARGFTDEEWEAAEGRLRDRGLLQVDGSPTAAGADLRRHVETTTDRLARQPWEALGSERTEELRVLLEPWATAVAEAGMLPVQNPMGLPAAGNPSSATPA